MEDTVEIEVKDWKPEIPILHTDESEIYDIKKVIKEEPKIKAETSAVSTETKPCEISKPRQDAGYKCLVCNIALFHFKEVITHVLTLHCSKGDYQCTLCNTQLLTRGSVKKHIKNHHFGFIPFTCPICKKQIQQKSHLKTHIEKQHRSKKRLLKKALANHKKLKPKDESLTCPLCHKVSLIEYRYLE